MSHALRQTALVLRQEVADGVRSRRAAVFFLLYLSVCSLMMYATISFLVRAESELSAALELKTSGRPGAVVDVLWKSARFQRMVARATDDDAATAELTRIPPVALIFGFPAFFFIPWLVLLVSSPRVADEVGSGSARYALLRVSRGGWIAGKFLAQAFLLALAILLGITGAWIVARLRGAAPAGLEVGLWMLWLGGRVWLYGLPYLGLAFAASMLTRSGAKATGLSLLAFIVIGILGVWSGRYDGPGAGWIREFMLMLAPSERRGDLWRTDPAHWISAAGHMAILACAYLGVAFAFFRRKDL